jgi:hypothetical protein
MSAPIGPGDLVECIDGSASSVWWDRGVVRQGSIYTVEQVMRPGEPGLDLDDGGGLILAEPETKEWDGDGVEGAWRIDRFRPIRKPNIEVLKSLLQPSPERELLDA